MFCDLAPALEEAIEIARVREERAAAYAALTLYVVLTNGGKVWNRDAARSRLLVLLDELP